MIFEDIRGENGRVIAKLRDCAKSGMVSHAYLFEGDTSTDKEALAKCFAKAILCREKPGYGCDSCLICNKIEHDNYEDLFTIEKVENSLKDADVAGLQERLRNKPLGDRNIAIIKDADTMTVHAQNRLLKTLEEPPAGTVIILLSENAEELLPTIVSRCTVIRLAHSSEYREGAMSEIAEAVAEALISREPFFKLKNMLKDVIDDKDTALEFLDALENVYGKLAKGNDGKSRLYPKPYIYNAVSIIEESRRDIKRNIQTGYVIKNLIIKIGG
ncbi:MAG: hypothetical protein IJC14_04515 [Firmicutes bacterium]|nr:hypothetical protein [Bacillota bacterium]